MRGSSRNENGRVRRVAASADTYGCPRPPAVRVRCCPRLQVVCVCVTCSHVVFLTMIHLLFPFKSIISPKWANLSREWGGAGMTRGMPDHDSPPLTRLHNKLARKLAYLACLISAMLPPIVVAVSSATAEISVGNSAIAQSGRGEEGRGAPGTAKKD